MITRRALYPCVTTVAEICLAAGDETYNTFKKEQLQRHMDNFISGIAVEIVKLWFYNIPRTTDYLIWDSLNLLHSLILA